MDRELSYAEIEAYMEAFFTKAVDLLKDYIDEHLIG